MEDKKRLNSYIEESGLYSSIHWSMGNKQLSEFYKYLCSEYKRLDFYMDLLLANKVRNEITKVATMISWPIVKHFSSFLPYSFYAADNELISIQEEIILKLAECLHKLDEVIRDDCEDVTIIHSLAQYTVDNFRHYGFLVGDAREYMLNAMSGKEATPIDYTKMDVGAFLGFFDRAVCDIKSLDSTSKAKVLEKIGNQ